jgi:hypothetical protein
MRRMQQPFRVALPAAAAHIFKVSGGDSRD